MTFADNVRGGACRQMPAMLCAALLLPVGASAVAETSAQPTTETQANAGSRVDAGVVHPVLTSWRLTDETYDLPNNERMGISGATMLFDVSKNVRIGAGTYGAVRGDYGGFITIGVAGEYRQPISERWAAHGGMFVGAGGGRNGGRLVGGGLMLRSDLGLTYQVAPWGRVGLGVSHVSFPSGIISSTQPYLLFEHNFYTTVADGWLAEQPKGLRLASPLSIREQELGPVYRAYKIPNGVVEDGSSNPQYPRLQLMGFAWQGYIDDNWFIKMEADGAMGGRSDGYMQLLGGAGYRMRLTRGTDLKLYGAVGAAGGGKVDTGGGFFMDAGISLRQEIYKGLGIEFSVGRVAAPSRSFKATSGAVQLSYKFGMPHLESGNGLSTKQIMGLDPEYIRVRVAQQAYVNPSANWRNSRQDQQVSNLGVQFDYFVSPQWFLTGQALAAYSGYAGSYMKGLVGAGVQVPVSSRVFVEAEGLVGAAGGGGLRVGGGFVAQANASVGYRLSKSLSVMGTVGRFTAPQGTMSANIVGVSLAYQISLLTAP